MKEEEISDGGERKGKGERGCGGDGGKRGNPLGSGIVVPLDSQLLFLTSQNYHFCLHNYFSLQKNKIK